MKTKEKKQMKHTLTLLTALLLVSVATVTTSGTETNTAPVERKFQALIVSADPARHTLRVRHKPTGYETEVVWDEKSVVKAQVKYDIDEIPEGSVECWPGAVDAKKKTVSRIGILRPVSNPAKTPAKADEVKEKSMIRGKLVRLPVDDAIRNDHDRMLTRKKDAAYVLEVNGEHWALVNHFGLHPRLTKEVVLTIADLKANLPCRELVYREESGGNRLVSAMVLPNQDFKPEEWPPLGPTGTTVSRLEEELKRFRNSHAKLAVDIRKVVPVRFRVEPEIVLKGEPINLTIEAWSSNRPNAQLVLEASYLQPTVASRRNLALDWKANEQADGLTRYTTGLKLPDLPVGQHCVTWACDVGGDIPEFWRSVAVTDAKTLVAMFHFTGGKVNAEFNEFRIPYDYWEFRPQGLLGGVFGDRQPPAKAAQWVDCSREYRRRGASPNIAISGANYAGGKSKLPYLVNFSAEPEEVQRAVLKTVREIADMVGFQADDTGFFGYEFGTRTIAMAREAGVRLVGSMCIHQNWRDGGAWTINHSARPLRPYFAGVDDFRKTGPGGRDGVVMVSQHDKSILWTEYGVGVYEPCWLEVAWLGGGGGREKVFDEIFLSRHLDLFSAAIENAKNQKVPFFQSIGIEFSGQSPMITDANAGMIKYAAERAKDGSVVFCSQGGAADFYRRHYQETPETLFYDADFWCGNRANDSITSTWKPVDYPDLVHIENHRYSAFFKKPAALPEYHWDYTKPWNYPDWGNEEITRSVAGFLVPGEHDKFAVTPKITDTRKMKVSQSLLENAGGLEMVIVLETAEPVKALPLALWDIPCEWKAGEGWWTVKGANRFVPIRAPYTGNLNGLLEVDAKPGKNEYRLTITTPKHAPVSQDILLKTVHAKVFTRDGQSMAYIWPTRPWETSFQLTVPAGCSVQYYAAPKGDRVDLPPGKHQLKIEKESWSRIVGLDYQVLRQALQPIVEEHK
jgi:hypothetical protein